MTTRQDTITLRERPGQALQRALGNPFVVSAIVGVGIWWLLSGRVFQFLPTPLEVGVAFVEALTNPEFYRDMAVSLLRVTLAATGAWLIAVAVGIAMAYNWAIETVTSPVVFIGLALPAPLIIFFSILIFGLGQDTTLIALLLVVTPYVVIIMYEGAKSRDKRLAQMGTVYRFSRRQRLRHIILPELGPSLMSGARFAFAMSWKIVVLVEALSSNVGMGERIHFFFVFLGLRFLVDFLCVCKAIFVLL